MTKRRDDGLTIVSRVKDRAVSAVEIVETALEKCRNENPHLNACTAILAERALREGAAVDAAVADGRDPGPLAGVPYAVKNLFDIAGVTTLAGSKIDAEDPPATADAPLIRRLQRAGACLLGATNMDEYAYGFSTENSHYGPTRNPLDPQRIAGGSSGGSAAIVAADIVPFSLGTDTNGSIRVPASLCGIYGLKPTYGLLPRTGTRAFVGSLDHVGPFARSARDLAVLLDVLSGPDADDPACRLEMFPPVAADLALPWEKIRCATLSGYFEHWASPEARRAVQCVGDALGSSGPLEIPLAREARSAAYLITVAEGAQLHLSDLRKRPLDFDPLTRDRFLAGALLPGSIYLQAQRFRRIFQEEMRRIFEKTDLLITSTTPISAPLIGTAMADFNGESLIARHNLGLHTQPFSLVGLPAISVPVPAGPGEMPVGVMLVGRPFSEGFLLRAAHFLEKEGVVR